MKKFSSTMKGSSRQTSSNKKTKRIFITGLILVVAFFVAPRFIGSVASFVMTPIAYFETALAKVGGFVPDFFRDRAVLIRENNDLERKLAYGIGSDQTTRRLIEENREMRRLLNVSDETRTAASVIGRPAVTPYDVLVIDKGSSDGIEKYAPVYIGIDQAIGYIAEAFPYSSVITLLSTPSFEASVYIYGPNIYTTARGIGGGVLQVSVPQGILLSVGDLVVVPALGSGVYGEIEVVHSVASEPEQRGYVTLRTPLQSIRFVSVGGKAVSQISFEDAVQVVDEVKKNLTTLPVPSGILVDVSEVQASSTVTSTDSELENISVEE